MDIPAIFSNFCRNKLKEKVLNFYSNAIQNLKEKNLYRALVSSDLVDFVTIKRGKKKLISFCSNDYFGLSQNPQVKKSAIKAINKYGVGSGASRYVTGNNSLYKKLETQIAKLKNCDDAIVFSSGYASSIGVISALVGEGDLIVADRLIHSSLIDGVKLSGAKLMRFLHNDIVHTKNILEENRHKFKKCLIITEGTFSMDGDLGEISELLKLAKKFDAILISDAAHDLFLEQNFSATNHLQLGTLSKAVGSLGGYVAGDKIVIDYLRNFAKSAIYSTALPASVLAASLTSLKIIEKKNLGAKALKNAQFFCQLMKLPKPQSAIVPLILGDNKKVLEVAKKVEQQGMLISAIRPPTVEAGKARLRITFSSEHKKTQIKKLAQILLDLR
jgi:8-amino-7-oxononanoate synthase